MTTKTHTNHTHRNAPETWFGAGLAFVAFLVSAAIPATVYGGYMGLMLSNVLFGQDAGSLLATRFMTGGGMLLGVVATLSLYLVLGAVLGSAVGAAWRKASTPVETETSHSGHQV